MMNYVKSEFYRVLHDRGVYSFIAILTLLALLLNALLGWFGIRDGASFRYNTTSFSFSNLVANPMVFSTMGTVVGIILYEGSRRNGNLKNTIAFGISRTKIFAGECIVASVTAVVSLLVVLTVYILSAVLFLEHIGPVGLNDLLTEIPAVFFISIASLISGIVFIEAFGKASVGIILWFLIWFVIPRVFFYLGLRIAAFLGIAMWMPQNFFGSNNMLVNMSHCITAWSTTEGMAKCVISGITGILVFSVWGIAAIRKREL